MCSWRSKAADALLWLGIALGIVFVLSLEGCAGDIAFNGVRGPAPTPRRLAPVPTPAPLVGPISIDGKPLKAETTWMPPGLPCVGGSCPVER